MGELRVIDENFEEAITKEIQRHEAHEAGMNRRAHLALVASFAAPALIMVAVNLFWSVP